ncbi:MAG: hypothetical protein NUV34_02920 [Sulfuricaulis sp.]|nr:hypothetical protein [Sulfuricaulis sp.]
MATLREKVGRMLADMKGIELARGQSLTRLAADGHDDARDILERAGQIVIFFRRRDARKKRRERYFRTGG